MISRRKLNHMASGLLGKFVGRNNDYQGYWAPGVLYTEARAASNRVHLDILCGVAAPGSDACTSLARTFSGYLHEAISKHGASVEDLALACVSIEFNQQSVSMGPAFAGYGEPFVCTLRLMSSDGRVAVRTRIGKCKPHHDFPCIRSTRYVA